MDIKQDNKDISKKGAAFKVNDVSLEVKIPDKIEFSKSI